MQESPSLFKKNILHFSPSVSRHLMLDPDDPRSCAASQLHWLNFLSGPGINKALCLGRPRIAKLFLYQKTNNKTSQASLGSGHFWVLQPFLTLWIFISTVSGWLVQVCLQPRLTTDDFKKYSYDSLI